MLRDYQTVRVLPGTPPGEYALEIGLYSQDADRSLPISSSDGPLGDRVILDRIVVERSAGQADLSRDLRVNMVLAEVVRLSPDGPQLLGMDWPGPTVARAGDGYSIAALWQAGTTAPEDTSLYLQLSDGERTWRRKVGHALGQEYPPATWATGELVRDAWTAYLPADAPAGRYSIELVAVNAAGDRTMAELGSLDLAAREHDFTPPQPAIVQDERLGDGLRLSGYDPLEDATAGAPITLTLYWQALDELPADFTRFVHLVDSEGRIVAQNDAAPGAGDYPTASWVAGETITDVVQLQLSPDLLPGAYRIDVGLYDPFTGTRLTSSAGQDHIAISQPVQVAE